MLVEDLICKLQQLDPSLPVVDEFDNEIKSVRFRPADAFYSFGMDDEVYYDEAVVLET